MHSYLTLEHPRFWVCKLSGAKTNSHPEPTPLNLTQEVHNGFENVHHLKRSSACFGLRPGVDHLPITLNNLATFACRVQIRHTLVR